MARGGTGGQASIQLAVDKYRVLHDCARQEERLSSKQAGLASGQKDVPSSPSRQVKLLLIHAEAMRWRDESLKKRIFFTKS